jgi:hypothetical protein
MAELRSRAGHLRVRSATRRALTATLAGVVLAAGASFATTTPASAQTAPSALSPSLRTLIEQLVNAFRLPVPARSAITLSPSTIDFGEVTVGITTEGSTVVTNRSNRAVVVRPGEPSSSDFSVGGGAEDDCIARQESGPTLARVLAPNGGHCTLTYQFEPTSAPGSVGRSSRTLLLGLGGVTATVDALPATDASATYVPVPSGRATDQQRVRLRGVGKFPTVSLDAPTLTLLPRLVGSNELPFEQTFFTNTSDVPVTIAIPPTGVGGLVIPWALEWRPGLCEGLAPGTPSGTAPTPDNLVSAVVAPGEFCVERADFRPTDVVRASVSTSVSVDAVDAADAGEAYLPFRYTRQRAYWTVRAQSVAPTISFTPDPAAFDDTFPNGDGTTLTVAVRNPNPMNVALSIQDITGDGAAAFTAESTTCASEVGPVPPEGKFRVVGPGQTCMITFRFDPATTGSFSAVARIELRSAYWGHAGIDEPAAEFPSLDPPFYGSLVLNGTGIAIPQS